MQVCTGACTDTDFIDTNTHACDVILHERVRGPPSASMTSSAPNGLQLSLGVINIPAVEILACVGKHDKTATHLSAPSTACHLSEAHNQTSAGLRSFLTDHLSSRLPACHSHAQSP